MFLYQVERNYRIAWIHNPKHFYQNSFQIEEIDGRKTLVGTCRDKTKNYHKVGILKPKQSIWDMVATNYHDHKNGKAHQRKMK